METGASDGFTVHSIAKQEDRRPQADIALLDAAMTPHRYIMDYSTLYYIRHEK